MKIMSEDTKTSQAAKARVVITARGGYRGEFTLRPGLGLMALAALEKAPLEFDCREADCGICIVRVVSGADQLTAPTVREADFLRAMHADPDERLACQCRVKGDVALNIEAH